MFDELTSESKRCLVLLASFVLVMPLGCFTPPEDAIALQFLEEAFEA